MHHSTYGRASRVAGMTIVEVLIVVVILAIAAATALPRLGATDRSRLEAAGRLLMADIEYAQMESISHADDPRGLKFDSGTESYTVVESSTVPFDCSGATAVTNPVGNAAYVTQYGAGRAAELAGVGIDSYSLDGDACLVFGPYGQLDQTTAATITLSSGAETLTISVDPVSGQATVSP